MNEVNKVKFWNYFSAAGTFGTFIFGLLGIFLIPSYVKDSFNQRRIQANMEVVNDLKELIYNSDSIEISAVNTLRTGKEIKFKTVIPYTQREIIVEVQESFYNDKFLESLERKLLLSKAEILKQKLPEELKSEIVQKSENNGILIIIYLLSALSLTVSVGLFISFLSKRKQILTEEFQKKFEEIEESKPDSILNYRTFENNVCEIINKLKLDFEDYTKTPNKIGFDFIVKHNDKKIGIEVKSRVNNEILRKLRNQFDNSGLDALIVISNKLIDFTTYSLLSDLKEKIAGRPIYFISGVDSSTIEKELMKILNVEIK